MNPELLEPCPSLVSCLQALSLIDIEEGMAWNVQWGQDLQELAQRASLTQDSAEVQGIQGKEALLANVIEEKMAHQI